MVMWRVNVEGSDDPTIDRLNKVLQRVWDEMTRLPWTDKEIALSLSQTLLFLLTADALRRDMGLDYSNSALGQETVRRVFAQPVRVELGGPMNIHTWA